MKKAGLVSDVTVTTREKAVSYDIRIGGGLLNGAGEWAGSVLPGAPGRVIIVSNKKVFGLYGETVRKSLLNAGFQPFVHLIGDGERFKNLKTLEDTLKFLSESKLSRT